MKGSAHNAAALALERTALPDVSITATAAGAPQPPRSASGQGAVECGQQLAHFRIDAALGAGGMGEVYLATDLALDRLVAVKVLPTHLAHDATRRERMIREARAQAQINHANVCHIYFVGEQDQRLFFAMEHIDGETFAQRCGRAPLTLEDALELVRAAACGLQAAQARGFIHRDVKPSNLMVDAHGVVKVLDFGLVAAHLGEVVAQEANISSVVAGAPAPSPYVAQTALAGTPLYMAPEQARGEQVDFRADMYALGCTLYQLLVGRPPFVADTMAALLSMHSDAARPALDRRIGPARFTAPVQALIARMMAPAAADRFVSYDALIAELDRVSLRRTRPAGFLVRLAAAGLDFSWLLALLVVPMALLDADGGSLFTVALMALFACFKVLITHRIGGTLGQRIFELEVIDVKTHCRPTLVKLVQRTALLMAPIAIAGATNLFGYLPLSAQVLGVLDSISEGMKALAVVGIVLALAVSSLRTAGRRTPWDRWSGTMVQYRKG